MSCNCESPAVCGCCEGPRILTPREIANRPGLDTLAVRIGTHASFFETMKARLASRDYPTLRDLTTRSSDDPAIAFLDAWATAADALTFYTERIANEGYLRTATERRSVLELARLIGYRPRPGVSASVFLAFTLDDGAAIEIPAGQGARNIPTPGTTDLPQTFETSHPLKARAELNRLRPRMSLPQEITPENVMNLSAVYLQGTALNLKPNDVLVFSFASDAASLFLRRVESATPDQENKRTAVAFKLEQLSVPFFLQKMRATLAALKKSAGFDVGIAASLERKLVMDANAFADTLAPKLAGNQNLATLDEAVVAASESVGSESKAKYGLVGKAIEYLAGTAADLLSKSGSAARATTTAREELFNGFHTKAQAFLDDLASLKGLITLLTPIPTNQAAADEATKEIDKFSGKLSVENLIPPVKNIGLALNPLNSGALSIAITELRAFLPDTPAPETDLTTVLSAIVFEKGPEIQPIVRRAFDPAPPVAAGLTIEKIRADALAAKPKFANLLAAFLSRLKDDFTTLLTASATVQKLDGAFDPTTAPNDIKPLIAVQRIFDPCADYSAAQTKIVDITGPEINYAKNFDNHSNALKQPPEVGAAFFNGFIALGAALGALRQNVEELRRSFIKRAQSIIERYAFLGTGDPNAQAVFGSLLALQNDLNAAEAAGIGAMVASFDKPLKVLQEKLGLAIPLRPTFLRLQADLRGLLGQVNVAPAPFGNEALDVSALGGGLDTLRGQLDSLRPTSAGDPLNVERKLGDTFQAGNRQASDMIARTVAKFGGVSEDEFFSIWRQFKSGEPDASVLVLRQKTGVFGNNSQRGESIGTPPKIDLNARFTNPDGETDWTIRRDDLKSKIALENEFPQVAAGGFVAVQLPGQEDQDIVPYRIKSAHSGPRSVYGITGKSTEVELEGVTEWGKNYKQQRRSDTDSTRVFASPASLARLTFNRPPVISDGNNPTFLPPFDLIRRTVVYVQSEALPLAEAPLTRDIGVAAVDGADAGDNAIGENDTTIMLGGLHQGLEPGRWLVVSGTRADGVSGASVSEAVLIERVEHVLIASAREKTTDANQSEPLPRAGDRPHTRVVLSKALSSYKRETVEIFGNVVDATHGETRRGETLGNGDARLEFQRFELKQPPLTFTAAPTPAGAESTLAVRVNDVLWHEVESFDGLEAADRRFITETDADGKTRVVFGNGREGARLPTGVENVKALYRSGIGKPGNVKAAAISQLTTKPLGLKEVINPLRSSGGADRDTRDQIRRNAPLAALALDRLVSVRDYQDFAQTFAGIGKASATRLTDTGGRFVHITVAGVDDVPIDPTSDLFTNFVASLRGAGDPYLRTCVDPRELVLLVLVANVRVNRDYLWEKVEPKLRAALLGAFSFERRALGQSVAASEVLAVMQAVKGVDYVDIDAFGGIPEKQADGKGGRAPLSPQEIADRVGQMKSDPRVLATLAGFEAPPEDPPKSSVPVDDTFASGDSLRPAQLAIFSPEVRDTLILQEIKP